MISVGIRELKNRLSEYLRMVRRGEVILVTDRGEAVAELHQPVNAPEAAVYPELLRRARLGKVRLGGCCEPRRPVPADDPLRTAGRRTKTASRRARRAVNLYAESSAVLAWLLGEDGGG